MKIELKFNQAAWAVRAFLSGCLLAVLVTACSSWRATTYKSVGTVVITADAAMKSWAMYVASGEATEDQERVVRSAYSKYQRAMMVVLDVGKTSTTLTNTAALDLVIASATSAQADLIKAVKAFVPPTLQPKPSRP